MAAAVVATVHHHGNSDSLGFNDHRGDDNLGPTDGEDMLNALDTDGDGVVDEHEMLRALEIVSVRADIILVRMQTESDMIGMMKKFPLFLTCLALWFTALLEMSPPVLTSDVHLHLFRHFALEEISTAGEMEFIDVWEYMANFANLNSELSAAAAEFWCERRFTTHEWDSTLSVPYSECASPRYYALGVTSDDSWSWTSVNGDASASAASENTTDGTRAYVRGYGISPLSCEDDDRALKLELGDASASCGTSTEACEMEAGIQLCPKSCGFCQPFEYESAMRYPKAQVSMIPVMVWQTRNSETECMGFAGRYQNTPPNSRLWRMPPLDGRRNGKLLHCLDRSTPLTADFAMEKPCPPSAPEGKCVNGKLQVTPKAEYQGKTIYPELLVVPARKLATLEKLQWLDVQTNTLTVSTIIYTEGIEVFTLLTVTFTFSRAGNVGVAFDLSSCRDLIGDSRYTFLVCMVVQIVGSLVAVALSLSHMRQNWHHCNKGMQIFELLSRGLLMAFSLFVLISWLQTDLMAHEYQNLVNTWLQAGASKDQSGLETFVLSAMSRIHNAMEWTRIEKNMAIVVIYFQFLQMIVYLSAHPKMAVLTDTIYLAAVNLIHFLLLFSVLFLMLGFMAHWMLGEHLRGFSSFGQTLQTQLRMLFGEFIYLEGAEMLSSDVSVSYWVYALTFMAIVFFTLLNFFLAIIVDAFCDVKEALGKQPILSGFFTDIWRVLYITIKSRLQKWPSRVKFLAYFKEVVDNARAKNWVDDLQDEDAKEEDEKSSSGKKVCAPPEAILAGIEGLTKAQLAAFLAYYFGLSTHVLCKKAKPSKPERHEDSIGWEPSSESFPSSGPGPARYDITGTIDQSRLASRIAMVKKVPRAANPGSPDASRRTVDV